MKISFGAIVLAASTGLVAAQLGPPLDDTAAGEKWCDLFRSNCATTISWGFGPGAIALYSCKAQYVKGQCTRVEALCYCQGKRDSEKGSTDRTIRFAINNSFGQCMDAEKVLADGTSATIIPPFDPSATSTNSTPSPTLPIAPFPTTGENGKPSSAQSMGSPELFSIITAAVFALFSASV